jgi:ABC-type phosphate/phosphonate transport system ATPase subunit
VSTLQRPGRPSGEPRAGRGVGVPPDAAAALRVAIIGNPNTGKTTLFNALTGLRQRVGNFAGVTVERVEGHFRMARRAARRGARPAGELLAQRGLA